MFFPLQWGVLCRMQFFVILAFDRYWLTKDGRLFFLKFWRIRLIVVHRVERHGIVQQWMVFLEVRGAVMV